MVFAAAAFQLDGEDAGANLPVNDLDEQFDGESGEESEEEDGAFLAADAPALELVHVIDTARAGPETPFEGFDTFSLNVVDVSGTGRPVIVTFNDNARAYVIDPLTGRVLTEFETAHPHHDIDAWHRQTLNGIGIGDVDGDGLMQLALLNTAARLELHEFDPANSTDARYAFTKEWEAFASLPRHDATFFDAHPWWSPEDYAYGAHGHAYIADVGNPDGAWVFAQSDDWPGQFAWNAKGHLVWKTAYWDGHSGPWIGDLEQDGHREAVFPTDNGHVVVLDAGSADLRWAFDAAAHGARPGSIPVMPLAADLDGDGAKELFVGSRVAVKDGGPHWMQEQHAKYFLLDADGNVLWSVQPEWGNPVYHMQPVPHDVTGDGVRDILVLDWNTIGHYPGEWEYLGPANLFVLDGATGETVWRTEVDMDFSRASVAVADFLANAPGPEVLVGDRRDGVDGLALVALSDGETRGWFPASDEWTMTRGPVLADVNGNGFLEAVVPAARAAEGCALPSDPETEREDVGCREGALLVFNTSAPAATAIWSNNLLYNAELDREPLPYGTDVPSWQEAVDAMARDQDG